MVQEVFSYSESRAWIPQDDLKLLVKAESVADMAEALVSEGSQSWGGDPQEKHVTVMAGTSLGCVEEALHHLQRLH